MVNAGVLAVLTYVLGIAVGVLLAQFRIRHWKTKLLYGISTVMEARRVADQHPTGYISYRREAEAALISEGIGPLILLLPDVEEHHE